MDPPSGNAEEKRAWIQQNERKIDISWMICIRKSPKDFEEVVTLDKRSTVTFDVNDRTAKRSIQTASQHNVSKPRFPPVASEITRNIRCVHQQSKTRG